MPLATRRQVLRHVVESQQFDRTLLEQVFTMAAEMEDVAAAGGNQELSGRIMASLFYEPSTRTRLSFEAAMMRLGGGIIGTESAAHFSSVAKGETLEDTVRIVSAYCDVLVLRHYDVGASRRAAGISTVPVINAGDGPGQHPTQALLDLYTIKKELGRIDGLRIAMVGDLANGRTVRSLSYLLSKFDGVELVFVAPPAVAMGRDIKAHLDEREPPTGRPRSWSRCCRRSTSSTRRGSRRSASPAGWASFGGSAACTSSTPGRST